MSNHLADFPPERFAIHAYCTCGHDALIDSARLAETLTIDSLRPRPEAICGNSSVTCLAAGGRLPSTPLDLSPKTFHLQISSIGNL